MKYHLAILIFSVLLVGNPRSTDNANDPSPSSCEEPLTWRIASIDSRFDLDEKTLKQLASEAANLWSNAVGQEVLAYSDSGKVAINLIYSNAQKFTDDEQSLSENINKKKLHYETLEQHYRQLSFRYNQKLIEFDEVNTRLQKTQKEYQQIASRWNTGMVVSKEENEKLDKLKDKISRLHKESEKKLTELNALIVRMYEQSIAVNNLADRINELIYQHREKFRSKQTFHQGAYFKAAEKRKINIYQFDDLDKLRLVLAHEMGHALGLGHVNNSRSVMYYLMEFQNARNLQLSQEDIDAIKKKCRS
ncbi:MAG: matrixin family metalloprotease [Balneolaceae bacterium]|nr:matrixin family metalloprotease [Balneolaceae bacterium]